MSWEACPALGVFLPLCLPSHAYRDHPALLIVRPLAVPQLREALLPSSPGVQYREIEVGTGREAALGATCEVQYIVYRLASGAYFKNSGGGTPVLLYALGYGFEGARDVGEVYRFRYVCVCTASGL